MLSLKPERPPPDHCTPVLMALSVKTLSLRYR